ncbi:MAG: spore coat protein [Firmicutes bacterium]|jgi:spore coat protein CotF|nr:spore coat protein [Bacillota bacterium]
MNEKDMVNDVLSMVNSTLGDYAFAISESSNQQLRQTLQQIRDADEDFQMQLAQVAEQKGYYIPAPQADMNSIHHMRQMLS